MHRATITVEGDGEIAGAIMPEMEEGLSRSSMRLAVRDGMTVIEIEAEDSTSLRASISSALRYISAARSAIDAVDMEE